MVNIETLTKETNVTYALTTLNRQIFGHEFRTINREANSFGLEVLRQTKTPVVQGYLSQFGRR